MAYDRASLGESVMGPADLTPRSHQAIANAAPRRHLVVAEGSDHDIPGMRPETIVQAVLSLM